MTPDEKHDLINRTLDLIEDGKVLIARARASRYEAFEILAHPHITSDQVKVIHEVIDTTYATEKDVSARCEYMFSQIKEIAR